TGHGLPRPLHAPQAADALTRHKQAKTAAARLTAALAELGYHPPTVLITATIDETGQPLLHVHITPGAFTAALRATVMAAAEQPTAARGHPPSTSPDRPYTA